MIGRLPWPLAVEFRKEPVLWVLAGIVCFILFLFLTFPYQALQARLLSEIRRGTGWEIKAVDWSVALPVGVEWHDLLVTRPGASPIQLTSAQVSVPLFARLKGQHAIEGLITMPAGGNAAGGRITGTLSGASWNFAGPTTFKARAQQLDLGLFVKPYVVKGFLQADIVQRWITTGPAGIQFKGDGVWKADIKDLVVERIPLGPATLPSLTFAHVTLAVVCRDDLCEITDLKGDGPDGSVTIQGRLRLHEPLLQTGLEITMTVLPGSGWAQKSAGLPLPPLAPGTPLTLKLAGTIANPRLSL
jgi:type II secretion system protein N